MPRRFRATVEYDGTDFAGFQVQRPGIRTVQGELETALASLSDGVRQAVDGAGRTDAGVHALGQVANMRAQMDARLERAVRSLASQGVDPRQVNVDWVAMRARQQGTNDTEKARQATLALHPIGRFGKPDCATTGAASMEAAPANTAPKFPRWWGPAPTWSIPACGAAICRPSFCNPLRAGCRSAASSCR